MPPPCTACGDQKSSPTKILLTCIQCERPWHHRCHRPVVPDRELVQIIKQFAEQKHPSKRLQWTCGACARNKPSGSTASSKSAASRSNPRSDVAQMSSASASVSGPAFAHSQQAPRPTQRPQEKLPSPIVIDDDSNDEVIIIDDPQLMPVGARPADDIDEEVITIDRQPVPVLARPTHTQARSMISVISTSSVGTSAMSTASGSTRHSPPSSTFTRQLPRLLSAAEKTISRTVASASQPTQAHGSGLSVSHPRMSVANRSMSGVSRALVPDFVGLMVTTDNKDMEGGTSSDSDSEVDVKPIIQGQSRNFAIPPQLERPALIPEWINARHAATAAPDMWDRAAARRTNAAGDSGRRGRKGFVVVHIPSAAQVIDPKGKGKARAVEPVDDPPRPHTESSASFFFSADAWIQAKMLELQN